MIFPEDLVSVAHKHMIGCGLSFLLGCSEGAENGFRQGKERKAPFKESRWKEKK